MTSNMAQKSISAQNNSSANQNSKQQNEMVHDMSKLNLVTLMKRPGIGKLGAKIPALVNFFKCDLTRVPNLLEYSFKVASKERNNDQITPRFKRRIILLLLRGNQAFKYAGSDYSSKIISATKLTPDQATPKAYIVDYFEEEENGPRTGERQLLFKVTLTFACLHVTQQLVTHMADPSTDYPQLASHIAALNIMIARGPSQNANMVTTARSEKFFLNTPNNGRTDLGFGLEVFKGFFRSCRPTIDGLMINLNIAASAMYCGGRLDLLITKMLGRDEYSSMESRLKFLDQQLTRLRIETTYLSHRHRKSIFKMARPGNQTLPPTAANIFFVMNDRNISVQDYFKSTYPGTLQTNPKAFVVDVGGAGRAVFVPSDLCTVIPGQPYKSLLPQTSQTTNMIRFACRRPAQNKHLILNEGLPQMGVGVPGGPRDLFGLDINAQMTRINARLLPKPNFQYRSGPDSAIGTGSWNMTKKVFKQPAPEQAIRCSWFELLLPGMRPAANRGTFLADMQVGIQNYTACKGAQIKTFQDFQHSKAMPDNFRNSHMSQIWSTLLSKGVRLVFVILPSKSAHNYGVVKSSADTMSGIHTICTVRDADGQLKVNVGELANLALKLNPKLGGVNLTLQPPPELSNLLKNKIMIIGADVVHPNSNSMLQAPSVACVVGSTDNTFFQYPGCFSLQQPDDKAKKAVEFIKNFGNMCEQRLELYKKKNGYLPNMIMIYRDGVADNMFAEVVNAELMQLQHVYKKMYTDAHPKTIFMVVKKRGHTRFFPPESAQKTGFDQNGNPLPGFVVDTSITSGMLFDWYLTSHKCLQGTSKPAHYVVLHDDLGCTADELQYFTFATCFLWGRATKSIGIHPAVRSADTMAERAKVYLHDVYFPSPTPPGQPRPIYRAGDGHWPGVIAPNLRDTMFYI